MSFFSGRIWEIELNRGVGLAGAGDIYSIV